MASDIGAEPARRRQLLDAFWNEVRLRGAPLIEADPQPGRMIVTFLWRGTAPDDPEPTEAVLALVNRVTDRRDLAGSALTQLAGTDVWHLSYRMRDDWLASYQLAPNVPPLSDRGHRPPAGTAAGPNGAGAADVGAQPHDRLLEQARPDPLSPQGLRSHWGGPAMSAVRGPAAPHPSCWIPRERQPRSARGLLRRLPIPGIPAAAGGQPGWVYEPPARTVAGVAPMPLLVMLDGRLWAEVADLAAALDHLIGDGLLAPLVAVLLPAPPGPERTAYFACGDHIVDDVAGSVLDHVRRRWPISDDPAARAVCGQSMGGLAAMWVASQAPESFGVALSQSGSFWWPSHDADGLGGGQPQWLTGEFAARPPHGLRARLAVGARESLLLEPTRRLYGVLHDNASERGCDVTLTEYNGGHDLLWWRVAVTDALTDVFGLTSH